MSNPVSPARRRLRILLGLVVALALAGATLMWLAPRGFVESEGSVGGASVHEIARLHYGGISNEEHYLRLYSGGRVAFLGRQPAGSLFLGRTTGSEGVWRCGRVERGEFDFRAGWLSVRDVRPILDEAQVTRGGTLTLRDVPLMGAGERCVAPESSLEGVVAGGQGDTALEMIEDEDELGLRFESESASLMIYARLGAEDAGTPGARPVEYAWVRERVLDQEATYRLYVSGSGSRFVHEPGRACGHLVLSQLSAPATCSEGPGDGSLRVSW